MAAPRALKPSRREGGSAADYYLDLAGRDLAAYYAGSGEAPGVAVGSGWSALADRLGVTVEAVADVGIGLAVGELHLLRSWYR